MEDECKMNGQKDDFGGEAFWSQAGILRLASADYKTSQNGHMLYSLLITPMFSWLAASCRTSSISQGRDRAYEMFGASGDLASRLL